MDIIISLLALFFLSPLLILVALIVKLKLGSPVIFKQERNGLNQKIFIIYKFRSMTNAIDGQGNILPDHIRMTKFGKFLRSTSLDELPSLLNILKGEMSIVGPRPQLIKDKIFMSNRQLDRYLVRPGLTGLAQVNGRNFISWDTKLELDLIYLKNLTFFNDLFIVLKTIYIVLKGNGVQQVGFSTSQDLGDWLLMEKKITPEEYSNIMDKAK